MSVVVQLSELEQVLGDFAAAYLLSTGADGGVKVVHVRPVYDSGVVRVPHPGRGSVANIGARALATLVFPPADPAAMTLLVDGTGEVAGADVLLRPGSAVLHQPSR